MAAKRTRIKFFYAPGNLASEQKMLELEAMVNEWVASRNIEIVGISHIQVTEAECTSICVSYRDT
jgi:hypothetical protein